jgi:hypothetical protein
MMRYLLAILGLLFSATAAHAQAVIVPAPIPALSSYCTIQRNATNTDWVCAPAVNADQPLTDGLPIVADNVDPTKTLAFQLSAITTGTARTWTIPNANVIIPATIASLGANTFTGLQTFNAGLASTSGAFSASVTIGGDVTASVGTFTSGLGTTQLNAANISFGTLPDARLSLNVLKHTGGYPGGTATFLRADGTFASAAGGAPAAHASTHDMYGADTLTGDMLFARLFLQGLSATPLYVAGSSGGVVAKFESRSIANEDAVLQYTDGGTYNVAAGGDRATFGFSVWTGRTDTLAGVKQLAVTASGTTVTGPFTAGAMTGGTYNGQTISSAASFTGSVTVATALTASGLTTLNGELDTTGGSGTGYSTAPIEVRSTGIQPRISFHKSGVIASQIGVADNGTIRTFDNPGTGYAPFAAAAGTFSGAVTGTNFVGPGTGLTGTAASLSIGGSAASATTATTATYATNWWSVSHSGTYYLVNNWDGTYWSLTSNHSSPVKVGYATSAGSAGSADFVYSDYVTASGAFPSSSYTFSNQLLVNGHFKTGYYIYPGAVTSPGTIQSSWYLSAHSSYGLYTNTGIYAEGGIWAASTLYGGGRVSGGEHIMVGIDGGGFYGNSNMNAGSLASGGEFGMYSNGVRQQRIDVNGDIAPTADNTRRVGVPSSRYTLVRAVTITPGDLQFENDWSLTESYKVGIDQPGLAMVDPDGNLIAFFGKDTLYTKKTVDVATLSYSVTTAAERAQIDLTPELRIKSFRLVPRPGCVVPPPLPDDDPAKKIEGERCMDRVPVYKNRDDVPNSPKGERLPDAQRRKQ